MAKNPTLVFYPVHLIIFFLFLNIANLYKKEVSLVLCIQNSNPSCSTVT